MARGKLEERPHRGRGEEKWRWGKREAELEARGRNSDAAKGNFPTDWWRYSHRPRTH